MIILIHIGIGDFKGARFMREDFKSQGLIEALCGALVLADRKDDLFEAGLGARCTNQFGQQQLGNAPRAVLWLDVYAPNPSLVAPLQPRVTREAGGSDELLSGKGAQNEITRLVRRQTPGQHFERKLAVLFGRLSEGPGLLLQSFQAQPPKHSGIARGQRANVDCIFGRV